jgi:serine/threonine-protein kinase
MTTGEDDLAIRAAARIGTVLRGKYHLDRVLGIGGMAVVYAATHRNRKQFAVKVLNKELSFHSDTRTRFLREGYVANSVGHPGSVGVLDDDVAEDGAAFLVMDLLDGETVEELWERSRRRLPLDVVLQIGHQLLEVLAAAHLNGIVHRDVKPANVFLTRTGQLKVLDFGIARLRDVAATHATNSGILLGTPAFMAPEQAAANASAIDARTDIWAVGATMYTLASGRLVHEAPNAIQVLMKAAQNPARSLGVVLPETPFKVLHVIDRALAFDKSARWPSAAAMCDAITDATQALPHRTQVSPPHDSLLNAAPVRRQTSDPAHGLRHDATVRDEDAALASTEPGKKSVAWPPHVDVRGLAELRVGAAKKRSGASTGDVATPAREESSGNVVTRFVFAPPLKHTLPSADSPGYEDEASKASTEPGKKRPALAPFEFGDGDETAVLGAVPSSDAPTKIREMEFDDAGFPASDEGPTDVRPPPDPRTATMTALSQPRSLIETVATRARPFGRQFLTPRFEAPGYFHRIARSARKVVPTRFALLARRALSGSGRAKLLRTSAIVISVVAGSLTVLVVAVRQLGVRSSSGPQSVSFASEASVLSMPAPVAVSDTTASARMGEATDAAASAATDPVIAVDELPGAEPPTPVAASATRAKPTVTASTQAAAEPRRPLAIAQASTVHVKPPAPPPPVIPFDQAAERVKSNDPVGARAALLPLVTSGKASIREVNFLKDVCRNLKDSACVDLCNKQLPAASKCNPPYDIDSSGKKIWKRECL